MNIDVSGPTAGVTTAGEVASALNANPTFSSLFLAGVASVPDGEAVVINKVASKKQVKFYFGNTGAEKVIGFNKMAPVAELPSYFERHTVSNVNNFEYSLGILIKLDESDPVDQAVIENAGFDPSSMSSDWELLRGRSGMFMFQKSVLDGSGRVTERIDYPAGAVPGDFAKKTKYVYSGTSTNPISVTEIPHVLTIGDIVSP